MATSLPAPSAAATHRIFPGWIVVGVTSAVLAVAYGMQFSFGVFLDPIAEDTGWSTTSLSLGYAVYVGLYSLLSSVSGTATDRYGPKPVLVVGGIVLGTGWALLGVSRAEWQAFLALGIVAAIGMSASWVPCSATVVRWFVRRHGLAVGVTSTGGSVGNLVAPPLIAAAIAAWGWRTTMVTMGVAGGLAVAALATKLIRSPESVGLGPDGDVVAPPTDADAGSGDYSFTVAEARRTSTFWVIFAIFASTWLVVFVPFVHVARFAESLGASEVAAAWVISSIGLGGIAGRLTVGPGSDRIGRRTALAAMLALQAAAFVGMAAAHSVSLVFVTSFVFGFAYGGGVTTMPGIVGDYFGRANVGSIVGWVFTLAGSLAAVGPFAAGAIYDATGSYRTAFGLSAAANLAALALVALLQPPRRPEAARGDDPPAVATVPDDAEADAAAG